MEKGVGRVFRGKNVGNKGPLAQQVVCVKAISRGRSSRIGERAGQGQDRARLREGKNEVQARGSRACTLLAGPAEAGDSWSISRRLGAERSVPGSLARSFEDQAGEIERQRKSITDQHGFGGVGQPKGGGTFDVSASLGGIATLSIGLPADTQSPGIGTNLHITRQADGTIGQGECGGQGEP